MAGHDELTGGWRKGSASGDGKCVEVRITADHVQLRDTKNRHGEVLTFTHSEWRAFLAAIQLGEFDIPE